MSRFLLTAWSGASREWKRFYRQRSRLVGSLATPVLFWIFLGAGLGAALPTPVGTQGGYMEYFFPGMLLLTVLFTSIFTNISVIQDKHEGFLQAVLVSPAPRSAIVAGMVGGATAVATLQGILFLLLAPLSGIPVSVGGLWSVPVIALASFCVAAVGFFFAWRMDSVQGFHSIMNLVLMPMWLLSGAFFPVDKAPKWLAPIMRVNPMTHAFEALRGALYGNVRDVVMGMAVLVCFSVVLFFFCSVQVGAVRRVKV